MAFRILGRFIGVLSLGSLLSLSLTAQRLSTDGINDMRALIDAKSTFTSAQKKMSSSLVFAGKAARLETLGAVPQRFGNTIQPDASGKVLVDIKANVNAGLLRQIVAEGGNVVFQSATYGAVRAQLPLKNVETVAGNADVKSIMPASRAHTNTQNFEASAMRASNLKQDIPQIAAVKMPRASHAGIPGLSFFVGAVTSQGYVAHRANQVVGSMGYDGTGVRVGVLSDSASAERVAALIASGDLPADVIVLPGQEGNGEDEGTAMMEIVHDIAPGAKLFFASAFNGAASFASNIHDLRFVYHCDIIVDDVTYFDEGAYQDGIIAQAVNQVTANGGLYFSAAANSGNLTSGTSGTWESDFKGYLPAGMLPGELTDLEGKTILFNNFGTSTSPTYFDTLSGAGLEGGIGLKWADPLGTSKNDYDLFVFDSTGMYLKGYSANPQTGTQDPFEFVEEGMNCGTATATGYCPALGDMIIPVLYNGVGVPLRIETNRGKLTIATDGATFGHNAGASTVSMAATYWGSAHRGLTPFTGFANPIETFSSDGPRKIFFNANGTAITPGNISFAKNGGKTLQKPDITAADGIFTKTPGFLPFFGTSAAAPHAAGIAALVKSAKPSLTNAQIKQAMTSPALDTMAPGTDRDSGAGITMALPAVQAALSMY